MPESFDVSYCRRQFPALSRRVGDAPAIFLDGPAGSQVPQRVVDAVSRYLLETNANHEGVFATSKESDEILHEAHCAVADLLGASRSDPVIFGPNMTSLTFSLSRSLSRTWRPGDEIIVTRLEHDANFTPWVTAAREAGAVVKYVSVRPEDCTLDPDDFKAKLSEHTRFVAFACASNLVGTLTPVREMIEQAKAVGAQVFLDAVHHAPHLSIDVADWGCDFLVCSAYKFFGPHVGVLWARPSLLDQLPVYKVRPAPEELPGRWMTGTQNHEGIAGVLAAIEYLADLGRHHAPDLQDRRSALLGAFDVLRNHEKELASRLLNGLETLPSVRIMGIRDLQRLEERVPTVSFTHSKRTPLEVAEHLARHGIFVWSGNSYALPLTEALGLEPEGLVRIGLLHYNLAEEVDRAIGVLGQLE